MQVICLDEPAFYALIDSVFARLSANKPEVSNRWIPGNEAMVLLNIKSKTSLQNLRDAGKIRYSQPQRKIILYDRQSIEEYLEKHVQNTF